MLSASIVLHTFQCIEAFSSLASSSTTQNAGIYLGATWRGGVWTNTESSLRSHFFLLAPFPHRVDTVSLRRSKPSWLFFARCMPDCVAGVFSSLRHNPASSLPPLTPLVNQTLSFLVLGLILYLLSCFPLAIYFSNLRLSWEEYCSKGRIDVCRPDGQGLFPCRVFSDMKTGWVFLYCEVQILLSPNVDVMNKKWA
jgi:hypothetical protein